jgi:hypothetical protein
MVVLVAVAHAEIDAAVVAETEADIGENKGSGSSVDGDISGNIGINSGVGNDRRRWQWHTKPQGNLENSTRREEHAASKRREIRTCRVEFDSITGDTKNGNYELKIR